MRFRFPDERPWRMSALNSGSLAATCICYPAAVVVVKILVDCLLAVRKAVVDNGVGSGIGIGNWMISVGFRRSGGILAIILSGIREIQYQIVSISHI